MSKADTWAVELVGLGKSYRLGWTGRWRHALQGLTLRLASGQVLGLLGPNGSGKSTTLKVLAGLLAPTTGECRIHGHPAGSDAARALVGYMPESACFPPHLTGREFLHYCAGLSSLTKQDAAGRVREVVAWTGLGAAAEQRLATCSKGMRQRIGLAQAVLHDPAVLLLDEPGAGLDPAGRLALNSLIRDFAARGRAVVFSSHLLTLAGEWCDQLALLGRGRLLVGGTREELLGGRSEVMPSLSPLEKLYLEKVHAQP